MKHILIALAMTLPLMAGQLTVTEAGKICKAEAHPAYQAARDYNNDYEFRKNHPEVGEKHIKNMQRLAKICERAYNWEMHGLTEQMAAILKISQKIDRQFR